MVLCFNYSEEQSAALNSIKNIDISSLQQSDSTFTSFVIFGDRPFDNKKSTFILDFTINYFISSGNFDESLFNNT